MPWVSIILAAIELTTKLLDRARQSGELTPEQDLALQNLANSIFAAHSHPPPPPPGVENV